MQNLITDVPGILIGQSKIIRDLPLCASGISLITSEKPMIAACTVRGGAPATRELELLHPEKLITHIDGICLVGGSAYGLAAADQLMHDFHHANRGFPTNVRRIPIIPTAALFDLQLNPETLPDYTLLAKQAYLNIGKNFHLGNHGAGTGAIAGKLKGGIGSASSVINIANQKIIIGAFVAVNSFGNVVLPNNRNFYGEYFLKPEDDDAKIYDPEILNSRILADHGTDDPDCKSSFAGENTTLAIIATNLDLPQSALKAISHTASDGLARAIRPCHTLFDGDILFAISTQQEKIRGNPPPKLLVTLSSLAADCLTRSVMRAILQANDLHSIPAYRN